MTSAPYGRRGSLRAAAAAVLLLFTACGSTGQAGAEPLGAGSTASAGVEMSARTASPAMPSPASPPDTAAPAVTAVPGQEPPQTATPPDPAPPPAMAPSIPASLNIPSVGTRSSLIRLDLDDNGSLEVPPGKPGSPAGWYLHSPTPGEPGPAVILGHVNAEGGGPGIFADLRKLQPGDQVEVAREDGSTAVFSVQYGEQYPKDSFPTEKVYGNTEGSELRLITCDGYDPKAGTFDDNYVVYARLIQ